ncbi:MAG: hypothetical protein K2M90_08390 [Treponemataceae bacterium]|nr:hypothetical protein [Treponemataceae bacterium]MDE7392458.1 hypothetical protein [Treponemataceae bacterium]
MKKFAAVAAALVLGMAVVSAQNERSIHAIAFDASFWNHSWMDVGKGNGNSGGDWSAFATDLAYHHLKVRENRFSSFTDVEIGYSRFSLEGIERDGKSYSIKEVYGLDDRIDINDLNGVNTRYMFGLGGAPVVTDLLTLAVHGTFGLNAAYAGDTEEVGDKFEIDQLLAGFWATAGVNVDAAFKFTGNFGVFAGINIYTNLIGFGYYQLKYPTYDSYAKEWQEETKHRFNLVSPGSFNIDLRLGVAFTY